MNEHTSLAHHFLVAMPSLDGTEFERSVIYIVEDTPDGTMGLMVNKSTGHPLREILESLDIPILQNSPALELPVHEGGPIDQEHGFILHQSPGNWRSSILLQDELAMTASLDLLEAIGKGDVPDKLLVTLGYTGWAASQLQEELSQNSWLTIPYSRLIMFDLPDDEKWEMALSYLGVSLEFLSAEAGHA